MTLSRQNSKECVNINLVLMIITVPAGSAQPAADGEVAAVGGGGGVLGGGGVGVAAVVAGRQRAAARAAARAARARAPRGPHRPGICTIGTRAGFGCTNFSLIYK